MRRLVALAAVALLVGAGPGLGGRAVAAEASSVAEPTTPATSIPMPTGPGAPVLTANVAYGTAAGETLLLDVYQPATPAAPGTTRPAAVLVHGGGWQVGDKSSAQPEGVALAAAGFVAVAPNYRLDAPNPWPAQLEDVQAAYRWLQDNAATYGVDPARIGAFGGSAGGNLAMLLATNGPGEAGRPPVKAVVSWSGPTDLITLSPTNLSNRAVETPGSVRGANVPAGCADDPNCIGVIDPSVIDDYLGCTVTQCPATYRAASPVFNVTPSTPPMQLASSEQDLVPLTQAQEMADQLNRSGVVAQVLAIPGDAHADAYKAQAMAPMVQFLTTYVADGADPRLPPGATTTTWLSPDAIGQLPESTLLRGRWGQAAAVGLGLAVLAGLAVVGVARARGWHPELRRPS